jgi:intraflagellar transport protein 52
MKRGFKQVPDMESLSQRLKSCLQEGDPIPADFSKLFDCNLVLFAFDTSLVPEAVQLYERLRVKHEPLRFIAPQFEAPLPPLQAAVFPPILREPPPPALDLFDLDEHFASERVRLAHLANKCNDDDMEYMCREAGVILGITKELEEHSRSGKRVLEYASAFAIWRVCAPYDHG